MASVLSLNVKYVSWWVSVCFADGFSVVSFDFGVLVGGGELKVLLLCHLVSSPSQEKYFLRQRER